jgi:hypothetical protein
MPAQHVSGAVSSRYASNVFTCPRCKHLKFVKNVEPWPLMYGYQRDRYSFECGACGKRTSESEGLGLSLLIYAGAILGVLALAALPVYIINRPQVYEIPPLAHADPLLNGPIVGSNVSTRFLLARIKRETIVDPAIVAALNEKARKAAPVHQTKYRTVQRETGTPVAALQPERKRPAFFLFSLFGG